MFEDTFSRDAAQLFYTLPSTEAFYSANDCNSSYNCVAPSSTPHLCSISERIGLCFKYSQLSLFKIEICVKL